MSQMLARSARSASPMRSHAEFKSVSRSTSRASSEARSTNNDKRDIESRKSIPDRSKPGPERATSTASRSSGGGVELDHHAFSRRHRVREQRLGAALDFENLGVRSFGIVMKEHVL